MQYSVNKLFFLTWVIIGRFHAAATRASEAQLSSGPMKAKAPASLKAVILLMARAAYSGAVLLPEGKSKSIGIRHFLDIFKISKNFVFQKISCLKNFVFQKISCLKNFVFQKISCFKKFRVSKISCLNFVYQLSILLLFCIKYSLTLYCLGLHICDAVPKF